MNDLRLYFRLLGISLASQMQYRGAFLIAAVGQFVVNGVEFLGIWALFDRFGSLPGWSLAEVGFFYGTLNVSFACADALATGFDRVPLHVRTGSFDRMLLRPRSTLLQLAGSQLGLHRVGRLLQGLIVLLWAAWHLQLEWGFAHALLLGFTLAGGACLFLGLYILMGMLAFWTVESLEVMHILTYGGVQTGQFPLTIYGRGLRGFFTFVVPLACICYFPIVALLGRDDPLGSPLWFQAGAPLAGVVFLAVACAAWGVGLRRYTSTGS